MAYELPIWARTYLAEDSQPPVNTTYKMALPERQVQNIASLHPEMEDTATQQERKTTAQKI